MTQASAIASDRDAIARALETYISGGVSGKSSDMQPAFHSTATIHGYLGPDLIAGPIQGLFDWIDGNGPSPDLTCDIANIDVFETVATARVECHNWSGHRFTDMFTLLKTDGEWKIVSKVFYLHPEH
ncbi:MAG: nuclear transport factor 2 family protein [Pyrinomonadaceae bacterium]|nr:nuclear transport factor 2 family protein [Pyrinomonadaceae bacterium]